MLWQKPMAETCFCRTGLNWFKPRFKPPLAETCQPWLQELKSSLESQSWTGKLWIQYIEYVDLVKLFIIAERTSYGCLHLSTYAKMLNLFAATGHYNYAKACHIYVQQMQELAETHPALHAQFLNGHHTICRSDRLWAGLSCDLVIEQTLTKSVKGRSGHTRGRGMHTSVRSYGLIRWVSLQVFISLCLAWQACTLDSSVQDHV